MPPQGPGISPGPDVPKSSSGGMLLRVVGSFLAGVLLLSDLTQQIGNLEKRIGTSEVYMFYVGTCANDT